MPIARESGGDFTPAPAGTHVARCFGMISLGTQMPNNPQFNPAFKIMLMFELPDEPIGDKCMTVSKEYTCSLSEKANLRHDLESWRGREFTPEELKGFDVSQVVGHPCMLSVVHQTSQKGKKYAKIASVAKLPKNMQAAAPVHEVVRYEIEDGKNGVFQGLPDFIQKKIASCVEWVNPAPAQQIEDEVPEDDPGMDGEDVPF